MKYANGGGYSPFVRTHPLVLEWADSGSLVKAYILQKYPYLSGTGWKIQNEELYGDRGFNYGKKNGAIQLPDYAERTTSSLSKALVYFQPTSWMSGGFLGSSTALLFAKYLNLTCGLHKKPGLSSKCPPFRRLRLKTRSSYRRLRLALRRRCYEHGHGRTCHQPIRSHSTQMGHTSLTSLLDDINEATDAVSAAATESLERVDPVSC